MENSMLAIYHTQMRLGHSRFNFYAFKFAFCDNDLCSCGQKRHCYLCYTLFSTLSHVCCSQTNSLDILTNLLSPGINYDLLLHLDQGQIIEIILKGSPDLSYAGNTQILKLV